MTSPTRSRLQNLIDSLPIISSHEHHAEDAAHAQLTLETLIAKSYAGWRGVLPGPNDDSRLRYFDQCRHGSYYVWLEKGIQKVYGLTDKLTAENWDDVDALIRARHAQPDAHVAILRDVALYHRAVQDTYWDYSSDVGHPDMFAPTMRTDMFIRCFSPGVPDHDANNPFDRYPGAPKTDFSDYLDFLRSLFTGRRNAGAVAMKSASAYERSLAYGPGDRTAAAAVFGRPPDDVSPADRDAYEQFVFNWFCDLAAELDVPFQIHTGLGQLRGSNPLLLEPTIERHPAVRFVLFHMSYPWCNEAAALAHNHENVFPDMCWGPLISPTAAVHALHQFIEVSRDNDHIAWGGDNWTSEESVGAALAWRHVLATVLAQKVDTGYLDMAEAETLAHRLMYRNAAALYGLPMP